MTRTDAVKYIIENTTEGTMTMVNENDLVGYRFWYGKVMTHMMLNYFEGMHYEVFQKWVKVYTSKGTFKIQRESISKFDVIGNGDMLAGISEREVVNFITANA